MIGDQRCTEATDTVALRNDGVVGERSSDCEADGKPPVEFLEVRMQT